jgi:hypothetical protein
LSQAAKLPQAGIWASATLIRASTDPDAAAGTLALSEFLEFCSSKAN